MRYAIPATALLGLVCLALTPVPVTSGLVIALVSLALIAGIAAMRGLDRVLGAVVRRTEAHRRQRTTHAGSGIGRRARAV